MTSRAISNGAKFKRVPALNNFVIKFFRVVFKFEGTQIVCSAKGSDFEKFRDEFGENERAFGYIRLQTGDEMSKRQKFILITWVGPSVSVIQRAKMSTDKALIKSVITVSNVFFKINLF